MATDSMILTPLCSMAGTVWNGFIFENSSVLWSSLASRIDFRSKGMFAALQKMTKALEGCDIKSTNNFKLILGYFKLLAVT